jgi:fibroblast growth factor 1
VTENINIPTWLLTNKSNFSGVREAYSPNSVLQLIPVGVGEVKIQGLESGLFLAMNSKGQLYAEEDESNDATIFLESSNGHYLNYLSQKYAHFGWYVGVTKEGRGKNGKRTFYPWGQKAIQFVSRKAYAEPHPLR